MIDTVRILLLALAVASTGCATTHANRNTTVNHNVATSHAIDEDRILVTFDVPMHNVAALSPSGRLDYNPPSAVQVRNAQLDKARRLAKMHDLQLEEDWPIPVLDVYCFVFRLNDPARKPEVLAELAADSEVDAAQPMQFFHGAADKDATTRDPLSRWDADLNERLLAAHARATGKSVTIAIVDTGIDLEHEDLRGASVVVQDLVDGLQVPPAETHGTAVAGLLNARAGNNIGIRGYTPDANILLLRACWEAEKAGERAVCNSFTLAKALSVALASDAAVVNLSISGPRDPLLERIAARFADNNQLLIAAGESRDTFPASVPYSIVAAHHANDDPSDGVLTLLPGNRYGVRSGTSMTAARVTGIAALMKQLDPRLSAREFRQQLRAQPDENLAAIARVLLPLAGLNAADAAPATVQNKRRD